MKEHYFGYGKQDQAEELKFPTTSSVRAINRKWKESLDDFTASNTTGPAVDQGLKLFNGLHQSN